MTDKALGYRFLCQNPPEVQREIVKAVDAAKFDELWVVEDCFFAGGIATTTYALAHTEHANVGLGIVPAVVRNAAFTAMEFAALGRLYPSRFMGGIGHGVRDWMEQIGELPKSQLTALEEVTLAVRHLIAGETVTVHGKYLHLDNVKLEFPTKEFVPISLGVRGPKSLQLSGRSADGTIIAEGTDPEGVKWAREQIAIGQAEAGRSAEHHRVTVYVWANLADDKATAQAPLRRELAKRLVQPRFLKQLEPMGITEDVKALVAKHGEDGLADAMPESWIDALTCSGTADDCLASIQRFYDAGADSVVLTPPQNTQLEQAKLFAQRVSQS